MAIQKSGVFVIALGGLGAVAAVSWMLLRTNNNVLVPRPNDYIVLSALAGAVLLLLMLGLGARLAFAFRAQLKAKVKTQKNDQAIAEHKALLATLNEGDQEPKPKVSEEQKNKDLSARYNADDAVKARSISLAWVTGVFLIDLVMLSTAGASWWLEGGDLCRQSSYVVNQFNGLLATDGPHNLCDFGRKGDHA